MSRPAPAACSGASGSATASSAPAQTSQANPYAAAAHAWSGAAAAVCRMCRCDIVPVGRSRGWDLSMQATQLICMLSAFLHGCKQTLLVPHGSSGSSNNHSSHRHSLDPAAPERSTAVCSSASVRCCCPFRCIASNSVAGSGTTAGAATAAAACLAAADTGRLAMKHSFMALCL